MSKSSSSSSSSSQQQIQQLIELKKWNLLKEHIQKERIFDSLESFTKDYLIAITKTYSDQEGNNNNNGSRHSRHSSRHSRHNRRIRRRNSMLGSGRSDNNNNEVSCNEEKYWLTVSEDLLDNTEGENDDDEDDEDELLPLLEILDMIFDKMRSTRKSTIEKQRQQRRRGSNRQRSSSSRSLTNSSNSRDHRGGLFEGQILIQICCGISLETFSKLPIEIIEIILEEHENLFVEDKKDNSAHATTTATDSNERQQIRDFVCELWKSNHKKAIQSEEQLLSIKSIEDLVTIDDANLELRNLWAKTVLLILHRNHNPESEPLLHSMIQNQYPLLIVWLATKLYSDELTQRDHPHGRIPLHYAYEKPVDLELKHRRPKFSKDFCFKIGDIDSMHGVQQSYVNLLLQRYRHGAKFADNHGKLPLVRYLEEYCCADDDTTRTTSNNNNNSNKIILTSSSHHSHTQQANNTNNNTAIDDDDKEEQEFILLKKEMQFISTQADIRQLIDVAPKALIIPDLTTRLFPFMIPSIITLLRSEGVGVGIGDEAPSNNSDELYFVSLTFDLLRRDPTVMNNLIAVDNNDDDNESVNTVDDSFHVKHLKKELKNVLKKLSKTTKQLTKQQEENAKQMYLLCLSDKKIDEHKESNKKLAEKVSTLSEELQIANETILKQQEEIKKLRALPEKIHLLLLDTSDDGNGGAGNTSSSSSSSNHNIIIEGNNNKNNDGSSSAGLLLGGDASIQSLEWIQEEE